MLIKGDREITCFGKKSWQLVSGRCKFQTQMLLLCNLLICHIEGYSARVSPFVSVWDLFPMRWALSSDSPVDWFTHKLRLGSCPLRTGSIAQDKNCLDHRKENVTLRNHSHCGNHGSYSTESRASQPSIHHQPKRCLQFLVPVIEDMCYFANSTDGKWLIVLPLWSLGNEREKEWGKEGGQTFSFSYVNNSKWLSVRREWP